MADKTKPPPEAPPSIYDRHLSRAPGPGKYNLPSEFGPGKKGAFRWSMAGKTRTRRDDETPGPDKYAHPRSSLGGTRHTMAARFNYRDKEDIVPDKPADGKAVVPPVVRSYIGQGPKFSMGGRVRPVRSDATPDPTRYNPMVALKFTTQKVPSYSMGARPRTLDRDPYFTPASGPADGKAVVAPVVKSLIGQGPKFSMGGRVRSARDDPLPGPGNYPGANLDMVGKSGPRYSMSARVRQGIQYGHWEVGPQVQTARLPPVHG